MILDLNGKIFQDEEEEKLTVTHNGEEVTGTLSEGVWVEGTEEITLDIEATDRILNRPVHFQHTGHAHHIMGIDPANQEPTPTPNTYYREVYENFIMEMGEGMVPLTFGMTPAMTEQEAMNHLVGRYPRDMRIRGRRLEGVGRPTAMPFMRENIVAYPDDPYLNDTARAVAEAINDELPF